MDLQARQHFWWETKISFLLLLLTDKALVIKNFDENGHMEDFVLLFHAANLRPFASLESGLKFPIFQKSRVFNRL